MAKTTIIITVVFFMPLNKFAANILKYCVANIPKRFELTKNFFPLSPKGELFDDPYIPKFPFRK